MKKFVTIPHTSGRLAAFFDTTEYGYPFAVPWFAPPLGHFPRHIYDENPEHQLRRASHLRVKIVHLIIFGRRNINVKFFQQHCNYTLSEEKWNWGTSMLLVVHIVKSVTVHLRVAMQCYNLVRGWSITYSLFEGAFLNVDHIFVVERILERHPKFLPVEAIIIELRYQVPSALELEKFFALIGLGSGAGTLIRCLFIDYLLSIISTTWVRPVPRIRA